MTQLGSPFERFPGTDRFPTDMAIPDERPAPRACGGFPDRYLVNLCNAARLSRRAADATAASGINVKP